MSRSSSYVNDPTTGGWTLVTKENSEETPATGDSSGNLTSSTPDKDTGTGSVEKKYNEIEINTLNGELSFIVNEETIKLTAGDTVELKGLGKYLSGNYYVKSVTRQISSSGYTHSASLIKTDFGKSLKLNASKTEKTEEKTVPSTPTSAENPQRTYTVKKGDTLWKIAKEFYGDGSKYNKIVDANTNKIANPNLIYVGQVFVIA